MVSDAGDLDEKPVKLKPIGNSKHLLGPRYSGVSAKNRKTISADLVQIFMKARAMSFDFCGHTRVGCSRVEMKEPARPAQRSP